VLGEELVRGTCRRVGGRSIGLALTLTFDGIFLVVRICKSRRAKELLFWGALTSCLMLALVDCLGLGGTRSVRLPYVQCDLREKPDGILVTAARILEIFGGWSVELRRWRLANWRGLGEGG
jgi:hypothetical protein